MRFPWSDVHRQPHKVSVSHPDNGHILLPPLSLRDAPHTLSLVLAIVSANAMPHFLSGSRSLYLSCIWRFYHIVYPEGFFRAARYTVDKSSLFLLHPCIVHRYTVPSSGHYPTAVLYHRIDIASRISYRSDKFPDEKDGYSVLLSLLL